MFPHIGEWFWIEKLIQENRICIDTGNIGYLTGKLMEIVDTIIRRIINMVCLQEIKWIGD